MTLRVDDFEAFFQGVHGREPFPWQSRLLREVVARGWPALLDLPTGSGKTAAIDVALFHMALAGKAPIESRPARRVAFIVDRRVVVDQAHERARKIAGALASPTQGVVQLVASALRSLQHGAEAGDPPLACALLRGGVPRETSWLRAPDQPLVVVSTVDQVGSRLLFRGYGVRPGMMPLHAGMFGGDVLFLLDEVHLSQPFKATLRAIAGYRKLAEKQTGAPFRIVELSATATATEPPFRLDDQDHDPAIAPALVQRLNARKPVRLVECKVKGEEDQRRGALTTALVEEALKCVSGGAQAVAIVVNQVDTARRVFRRLVHHAKFTPVGEGASGLEVTPAEVAIVTGRMRQLDQHDVYQSIAPRVVAGRAPRSAGPAVGESNEPPALVVVATQCLEAGADLDFDALVTECASIDALKQRFGRLDRLGELTSAGKPGQAVIVGRSDVVRGNADDADPIYGVAAKQTWLWLTEKRVVDFGIRQLPAPSDEELKSMTMQRPDEVVLLPAHLDTLVQTAPIPRADPAVSVWLHPPKEGAADVSLVWRSDLLSEELRRLFDGLSGDAAERTHAEEELRCLIERVGTIRPSSLESLSVSIGAAAAWFRRTPPPDLADIEGANSISEVPRTDHGRPILALRWRGRDSEIVDGRTVPLVPGDTFILPAEVGGLRHGVWDPEAVERVEDIAERAQLLQRGLPVLRFYPDSASFKDLVAALLVDPSSPVAAEIAAREAGVSASEWRRAAARLLVEDALGPRGRRPKWVMERDPADANVVRSLALVGTRRRSLAEVLAALPGAGAGTSTLDETSDDRFTTDEEESAVVGAAITLRRHSASVERFASAFVLNLGLPEALARDVALAGYLHDLGKADPRFQAWLRGGNRLAVDGGADLLAKSATQPADWRTRREERRRSGYPQGARHEMLSVAMVQDDATIRGRATDWDLVLHLIASHHGHARPLAPAVDDQGDEGVQYRFPDGPLEGHGVEALAQRSHLAALDSGVAQRFWTLVRRYGWFDLAWLEAILRLADHRASEADAKAATVKDQSNER